MIRLLIDQSLPRRAAGELRARGWDVQHVGELGMSRALDEEILEYAAAQGLVVVTHDGDFADLLAVPDRTGPSVMHIRIPRVSWTRLVALVDAVVPGLEKDLGAGCMVSVDEVGARVRRLPIT